MRLIQIRFRSGERRVGMIEDERIILLEGAGSVYSLAREAVANGATLSRVVRARVTQEELDYDTVYDGASEWRILPAMDHPEEPSRCVVSGTGLTHLASAQKRQSMHAAGTAPTDSMRMYEWGVEGGRPAAGKIGTPPEWFYKGTGTVLRAHNEPLLAPAHAEECGEEPEIAGVYFIDPAGTPRRLGMAAGNEFSDHRFEKKNYLYLAASKLMTCAIGPELIVEPEFGLVRGEVSSERSGAVFWSHEILTGEAVMSHSLANIEHHHFKHAGNRRPGDVHIHFLGADAFSFGEGITLQDGDVMQVRFAGFGRPLRNPLRVDRSPERLVTASPL